LKTAAIQPAKSQVIDPGAISRARDLLLPASELPARWRGRRHFVVLETGFGAGCNFLATWQAWRDDPQRAERLHYISLQTHPPLWEALHQAHANSPAPVRELAEQLVAQWPPLCANLHRLSFEGGRVDLLLGLSELRGLLRELVAQVDAFYLDDPTPAGASGLRDAYLLKSLARLAAPDASAATGSTDPAVLNGLRAAGFDMQAQGRWRFAPRHATQGPAGREPLAPGAREAVILGAGLAGAGCAHALAQAGVRSTVLDAHGGVAKASSGNPGGLFHGTLNPDDSPHARFNRAAALATRALLASLPLPWRQDGLLRLETRRSVPQMRADLAGLGLPADYVQALGPESASQRAGLALSTPAWFYPGGGALPPAAYCEALFDASRAELRLGQTAASLRYEQGRWQVLDPAGRVLASAPLLVLAGGHAQLPLLTQLDPTLAARLRPQRGQLSQLDWAPSRPAIPLAGDGYAIADAAAGLWCGATATEDDPDPELRAADHADNLQRCARLLGWAELPDRPTSALSGRVGWRLLAPDRLPVVGGLAAVQAPGARDDQLRLLPRLPGLVLCTAMASRGISWSALAGQLVAALALGTPRPLEADLMDAVDPLRFALRERARQRG
jgi:tRNA 5-methylaminomethyl-2-thiouridine biosynthesis bifunctional protein